MDLEAPADAWYVFLATSIVSVAVAGVVLGLPTGPPPDANRAANTIETVAGSATDTSATWEYDAETIVVDGPTIELENDHGTAHASVAYGPVVPVADDGRLENVTHGAAFEDEYDAELDDGDTHAVGTFLAELAAEYEANSGDPLTASGELVVRRITLDPDDDALTPLVETVELTTTTSEYGVGEVSYTGIGDVRAAYDGIDGNRLELAVDGEYVGPDSGSISDANDEHVFGDGSGDLEVDIESSYISRPGSPPVDAVIEFDDGETCERTLGTDSAATCRNTVPRSADLDDDQPFVDHDGNTGTYHVTLVTV